MTIQGCIFKTSKNKISKTDYVTLIIAAFICGSGFALNSETVIIGSMLISPLLKPFTNMVIALFKKKIAVASLSLIQACIMSTVTIIISIIAGLSIVNFTPKLKNRIIDGIRAFKDLENKKKENDNIENTETAETIYRKKTSGLSALFSRAGLIHDNLHELMFALIISICGGILLARSHCEESTLNTTIIGIGISTSILPPMIAAGIFGGVSVSHQENGLTLRHCLNCASVTGLNILGIYVAYWITLWFTW